MTVLASLTSLTLALFTQARAPLPNVTAPPKLSLSATSCRPCHEALFDAWRTSRHAAAATNAVFRASFRLEPQDWCKHCHAPLPEQVAALKDTRDIEPGRSLLVDEGVTCAVCHVRDGEILAAHPASAAALRAHPIRVTPELSASAFCGNCHQVNWPLAMSPLHYSALPMQNTLVEWQRARSSGTCQRCHMPAASHRFSGGHDADWLRQTLSARVFLDAGKMLHVVVQARGLGHRFPTGDPFRRLQADICAQPDCAEPLVTFSFGVFFRERDGRQVLMRDTALPVPTGSAQRVARELRGRIRTPDAARFWRLRYAYAAPTTERALNRGDIATEIASGRVERSAVPRSLTLVQRTRPDASRTAPSMTAPSVDPPATGAPPGTRTRS